MQVEHLDHLGPEGRKRQLPGLALFATWMIRINPMSTKHVKAQQFMRQGGCICRLMYRCGVLCSAITEDTLGNDAFPVRLSSLVNNSQ